MSEHWRMQTTWTSCCCIVLPGVIIHIAHSRNHSNRLSYASNISQELEYSNVVNMSTLYMYTCIDCRYIVDSVVSGIAAFQSYANQPNLMPELALHVPPLPCDPPAGGPPNLMPIEGFHVPGIGLGVCPDCGCNCGCTGCCCVWPAQDCIEASAGL